MAREVAKNCKKYRAKVRLESANWFDVSEAVRQVYLADSKHGRDSEEFSRAIEALYQMRSRCTSRWVDHNHDKATPEQVAAWIAQAAQ